MYEEVQGVWRGLGTHGEQGLSVGGEHGRSPDHPNPRQGRPGTGRVLYTTFLRVEILKVGTTWYPLGLRTEAFPNPVARGSGKDRVQGPNIWMRSGEERMVGRGEPVLGTCLFSSSFIFLPPVP